MLNDPCDATWAPPSRFNASHAALFEVADEPATLAGIVFDTKLVMLDAAGRPLFDRLMTAVCDQNSNRTPTR
jgi:hypothetical protein